MIQRKKIKTLLVAIAIALGVISIPMEKADAQMDARVVSEYKKESPPADNRWRHYDHVYRTIYFQTGFSSTESQTDIRSTLDKVLGISRYLVKVTYRTY